MKRLLIALTIPLTMFAVGLNFQPALAQGIPQQDKDAACSAFSSTGDCTDPVGNSFDDIWKSIINVTAFIVGIISVLMIVIGGLRYVLSSGDPQGTAAAKNTIIYAIVGLVIAISARSIVLFVLDKV